MEEAYDSFHPRSPIRLAVLGGSFDPVHNGHLSLADAVCRTGDYDRVIFIPTAQSPFKSALQIESSASRLAMLAASLAGDSSLTVDDCEIRRGGISYTIDTVTTIIKRYKPSGKVGLIIGDDVLAGLPQWKHVAKLIAQTELIVANRTSEKKLDFPFPYRQLHNSIMNISSSMVRDFIRTGKPWHYLVPPAVRDFIRDHGLYGCSAPHTSVLPSFLSFMEQTVYRYLSLPRFLHSRNVALLCADLCRHYDLDENEGYLAGITHDICRECTDDILKRYALNDGRGLSSLEEKKTVLLHARAGAVLLHDCFGITDAALLEAVRVHTVGEPGMGPLAKILYLADKVEVSRQDVDPALRAYVQNATLDQAFNAVVTASVSYLHSQKQDVSPETLSLLECKVP
ncbi:MAG: nicotinate (nicotinamide) nucleotide adenylyltransferase [Spirochaetaceae bacterium]|nr:nicotinate (nicotinamide) nucleotide adenylyltransferase [Spirochaetaceae bacterium]